MTNADAVGLSRDAVKALLAFFEDPKLGPSHGCQVFQREKAARELRKCLEKEPDAAKP
jgi:hypothetical protein